MAQANSRRDVTGTATTNTRITFDGAFVERTTSYSLTGATVTVTFDNPQAAFPNFVDTSVGTYWKPATDATKLFAPVDGIYFCWAQLTMSTTTAGNVVRTQIIANGSLNVGLHTILPTVVTQPRYSVTGLVTLTAGQFIQLNTLSTGASVSYARLGIMRVQ